MPGSDRLRDSFAGCGGFFAAQDAAQSDRGRARKTCSTAMKERIGSNLMPRETIRPLRTYGEFRACEQIQTEVWGNLSVAAEVLSVTQKYGGLVLGTFVGKRQAGFLYAFLARRDAKLIHWSHMMAVLRDYRDLGLGFRMKLEHRRLALQLGVRAICWTYDPLQSRNASLNLRRLGGEAVEYIPNCYGRFESEIEKGLPSDRFVVRWRIGSAAVERLLRYGRARTETRPGECVNLTRVNSDGWLENRKIRYHLDQPRLRVEIPLNTDAMRAAQMELALRWRMETRRIFARYLGRGFRVCGFIPPQTGGGRCYYDLCKP